MKHRSAVYVIVIISFCCTGVFAQRTQPRLSAARFALMIRDARTQVRSLRAFASGIRIEDFNVSYEEGKIFEQYRDLALTWCGAVEKDIANLETRQTFSGDLQLLLDAKDLDHVMSEFTGQLANIVTGSTQGSEIGMRAAESGTTLRKEWVNLVDEFTGYVMAAARRADGALTTSLQSSH